MPSLSWLDAESVRKVMFEQNFTVDQLVEYLGQIYPNQSGLSKRNVSYFLSQNGICKPKLCDADLDAQVAKGSSEVGGTYGRKLMKGYLAAKGLNASDKRIGRSLRRVAPYYHQNRAQGIQNQLNPVPYFAPYFGYNLHMDQNEKLVDYGIVFVIAVDGHSAFITSGATMPKKNNLQIYQHVFGPSVANFGLWDSLRCDYGKEFFLVEHIQHYLSPFRLNATGQLSPRDPYKQMPSTSNNRVERLWGEVNPRVGFPVKYALIDMETRYIADRTIPHHLFAMSQIGMKVADVGLQRMIQAWNFHSIPGNGVPNSFVGSRQNYQLPVGALPDIQTAVNMYQNSGGNLTEESVVGQDLLGDYPALQAQRDHEVSALILQAVGSPDVLFGFVSNHSYWQFQHAISLHISTSERIYNAI